MLYDVRWCAGCEADRPFETPPCEESHGADCPDLACVECGHAIVVGVLLDDELVLVEAFAA
jgi:hypothetical protein